MGKYIISHDLGTGGDKCTIFDEMGRMVAKASEEVKTYSPEVRWSEQKPEDWWEAVKNTNKKVLDKAGINPGEVEGIGFDAHTAGCVPVDSKGNLLRDKTIIWNDGRSVKQGSELVEKFGFERWYNLIGGGHGPEMYTSSKILWMKENERDIYDKTYKFLGTKDYIVYKLTGSMMTDFGDASTTGMLNLKKREWAKDLLESAGIDINKLPELHKSTDIAGYIKEDVARELGMVAGTPVVAGTGDLMATTVGAVTGDKPYCYIGTSSWITISGKEPILSLDSRPFVFCHAIPDEYVSNLAIYCAGDALKWLRDNFCFEEKHEAEKRALDVYNVMDEEASKIRPGSGKLLFIPHLMGGGAARKSPNTRGAFIGLGISHGKGNVIRSVLEGVSFALKDIMEEFEKLSGQSNDELYLVGGGGKSDLWRQILANVMNKKIVCPLIGLETASFGTAVIVGVGIGLYKDFSIRQELQIKYKVAEPDKDMAGVYKKHYEAFCRANDDLKGTFDKLAEI